MRAGDVDVAWLSKLLVHPNGATLGRAEGAALVAGLTARSFERGAVVMKAGAVPEGVLIFRSGRVELVAGAGRDRSVVQLLRGGDFLGDSFLLAGVPSPFSARAVEATDALFLEASMFERLLTDHPGLALGWLKNAAGRLMKTRHRITEVLGKRLPQRVAALLLDEAIEGTLELPQRTIAEVLGVQRTSLNKVLGEFADAGLIALGYGRVEVLAPDRLEQIAI